MPGTSTTESCSGSGNTKEWRPKEEMGYLYLEKSTILVLSSNETPSMHCGKWIDVEAEPSAPEDEAESISSDGLDEYCSRCDLVVKASETSTDLSPLIFLKNRSFDGTIKDLACPCVRRNPKRSDAALLMGLAAACQDLDHILIQSVRVRLLDQLDYLDTQQGSETSSSSVGAKDDSTRITYYDASLVITFALPNLEGDNVQRSIQPLDKLKKGASTKPLPACTQLLLSIARSDWAHLDQIMRHDREGGIIMSHSTRKETPSLFPKKLSLEEVFQRINGAATILSAVDHGELSSSILNMRQQVTSRVDILNLPKDVLVDKVACYLSAQSLDALRCSCKYLHHMLRSVVPGLNLRLYSHQVKSLSWMRIREVRQVLESDLLVPTQYRALFPDGDPHRVVSGGATTLLRTRTGDGVRISQYGGGEVHLAIDIPLSRTVARGGLLCDDPGLGKTITVLALILQTFGLSTEVPASVHESGEAQNNIISDDRIFAEYWKEQVVPEFRRRALTRLIAEFLRCDRGADYFVLPVVPERDGCSDYFDVIKQPICFGAIRKKVDRDEYGDSFALFESDAVLCFRNATLYHTPDSPVHVAARRVSSIFETMVDQFKNDQLHAAKKSFARASVKPNSAVAALIEKRNRTLFLQSLVPSSGTLLVVPSVLMEHWQDQLRLHVDIKYCTEKIPLVFEYTGTTQCGLRMEDFVIKCKVKNTHEAFAFIDKTGTKKLPSPEFLSMFRIVITTNQRFTNEWKNGSFEEELKRKIKAERQDEFGFRDLMTTSEEACPLLKVNWLRMVVDEGHSMGKGKDNSAICFASWISAERRWAMTGTPTRQTASQSGLSNILGLMRYLQHDFFSRRCEGESVWQNMIASWNHGHLSAFARLRSLLSLLMVRHTKMDIEELPPPHFRTSVLPMSYEEVTTYNTLVCAVQSNLLITSMEGKTSGAQDSLLHRSQAKHAKDALRNVRLVCSGGTRVIPTLSQRFWNEFFADMRAFTPPEYKMTEIRHYLHRAVMEQLSPCNCCKLMLSTLLVYPCGDLVCTECADHRSNCCVVCEKEFNVDDFQRLQPGMDYQWLHNIEEESKKKKVAIAAAVNESDENASDPSAPDHDIFLVHGAGNLAPLDPERQRRRTRKFGDGHTCEYDKKCTTGECTLCWKEHDTCNLLNIFSRCQTCFRTAEKCPESESKSSYIIDRLLKLCDTQQNEEHRRSSRAASLTIGEEVAFKAPRKLKVIVFSQFRKVLNMVGDRLLRRLGTARVAEYWGKFRKQELHKFIYSDECLCMLLGKDGSEGLDLSFVTHIFFIEQVWDKSLEHQAVARAWRMGAKGSVEVETLIAENSVEETMRKLEHNLEHRNDYTATVGNPDDLMSESSSGKNADYQRAKLQFLLKGLKLIKSSYTLPFQGNKRKVEVEEEVASTFVTSPFATKKKAKGSRVRFKL